MVRLILALSLILALLPGIMQAEQASDKNVEQFILLYNWEDKYTKILDKSIQDYLQNVRKLIVEKYPKQDPEKSLKEIKKVLQATLAWKRIHPQVKKEVKRSFPPRMLRIAINFKKEGRFRHEKDKLYMQENYRKPAIQLSKLFLHFLQTELKREAIHISEIMDGYKS